MSRCWWLVVLVTACGAASWQVEPVPPSQALATSRSEVRLTLKDGSVRTIRSTQIVHARGGDRVVGFLPHSTQTDWVPIADVRQVETPETFGSGTVAAATTCVVLVFLIAAADAIDLSNQSR